MRIASGESQLEIPPTQRGCYVPDGGSEREAVNNQNPTLPPQDGSPARILGLPGAAAGKAHRETLSAVVDDLDPDAIVAVPPQPNIVRTAVPGDDLPILLPSRGSQPTAVGPVAGGVLIISVPSSVGTIDPENLQMLTSGSESDELGEIGSSLHCVCVTPRVSLDVDPYERRTSLNGIEAYHEQLPDRWLTANTTHCSTALRSGFRTTAQVDDGQWSFVGLGQTEAALGVGADDGDTDATVVDIYPNGAVRSESVDPMDFGLLGIDDIGEKRAQTLRQAGYTTPADVANAPPNQLATLTGFGKSIVETIQAAVTAQVEESPVATGDDSLPHDNPVYIDIETDGLEPSTAWLIGVLDGSAKDGHYMAFTEEEPGDASHIEAFLSWAQANARGRPLVAWNGYKFDFPVLTDQIQQHLPNHLDAWNDMYQFDLLWWARDKNGGNAALPGRSNNLDSIAESLGWEPQTTGIDGSVVAKVYTTYRSVWLEADDPSTVSEPNWERLEAYCEDDVRALATIYEALADASRRAPGTSNRTDTGTQGSLSDFT